MQPLASIPSPSQGVWHLGPLPLRAYAFMIIIGIIVAVWYGERRWTARGGTSGTVVDIAVWAVPFGLVGGRLYHVITDHQLYFGSGANWNPVGALEIWNGGLGIWGAIALGGVGAWIGCRRRGVNFRAFADALAPGIALAQAFGRWGNYFNQELYGRPLHTFWALHIDQAHRPKLPNTDQLDPKYADVATYHPTFLYESIWCVGVAILVVWAGKRYKLNWGRSFALYVAAYTVGRGWIEALRIDSAHHFLGLRLNDYTSIIVFLCAVAYMYIYRDKSSVEEVLETHPSADPEAEAPEHDTATADQPTPEPEALAATTAAPTAASSAAGAPTEAVPQSTRDTPTDEAAPAAETATEHPATADAPSGTADEAAANPTAEAVAPAAPEAAPDERAQAPSATPAEASSRPEASDATEAAAATPDEEAKATSGTPAAAPEPTEGTATDEDTPSAETGPADEAAANPTAEAATPAAPEATPDERAQAPSAAEHADAASGSAGNADRKSVV